MRTAAKLIKRTPILGVQLLHKTDGVRIVVGIDGMESFTLGPYEQVSIAEALVVAATDIRLDNKFGSIFDV